MLKRTTLAAMLAMTTATAWADPASTADAPHPAVLPTHALCTIGDQDKEMMGERAIELARQFDIDLLRVYAATSVAPDGTVLSVSAEGQFPEMRALIEAGLSHQTCAATGQKTVARFELSLDLSDGPETDPPGVVPPAVPTLVVGVLGEGRAFVEQRRTANPVALEAMLRRRMPDPGKPAPHVLIWVDSQARFADVLDAMAVLGKLGIMAAQIDVDGHLQRVLIASPAQSATDAAERNKVPQFALQADGAIRLNGQPWRAPAAKPGEPRPWTRQVLLHADRDIAFPRVAQAMVQIESDPDVVIVLETAPQTASIAPNS